MPNDQGEKITTAVLDLLNSQRLETFNFNQICQHVQQKLGLGNPTRITVVINTLIASKTISGKANTWARYRDPNAPKGFGDMAQRADEEAKGLGDAKESAYKKEVAELKTYITELQNKFDGHTKRIKELEVKARNDEDRINELNKNLSEAQKTTRIVAVQVKKGEKVERTIEGLFHIQFERILRLAQARMNVFIYGPTGSGKTHIARQVADALDLRFGFISCTAGMGEATLGGRLLPIGKQGVFEYVHSEFVDFYENGGVYLLDELDAADPNVMLLINAALANGWITVSNRHKQVRAEMHPDFVCMAAGNTIGTGADRMYSARNKLDASTMDRFSVGKVYMDYDQKLEEQLCSDEDGKIDEELLLTLWGYREKIQQNRMERAMSTRFLRDAYLMKSEFDYSMDDINAAFFMGWREDEVNKVKAPSMQFAKEAKVTITPIDKDDNGLPQEGRESGYKRWDAQKLAEFKREMAEAAAKKKAKA